MAHLDPRVRTEQNKPPGREGGLAEVEVSEGSPWFPDERNKGVVNAIVRSLSAELSFYSTDRNHRTPSLDFVPAYFTTIRCGVKIRGRHDAVARPGDILFHIRATRMDLCFELATRIMSRCRLPRRVRFRQIIS
jgi:Dyp-type peroxidase family protein